MENVLRKKPQFPLKWSYVHCPGSEPLVYKTVGQVLDSAAARFPDREAVVSVFQDVRKTYAEVRDEVNRLAAGFSAAGLRAGDRIAVWGPNSYQWYLTQFAASSFWSTLTRPFGPRN